MQHSSGTPRRRPGRILLAILIGGGLIAAACGGDDDDAGGGATAVQGADTTAAVAAETSTASGETTTGDTTAATDAPETTQVADTEGEPVPGGKLTMGIEADTAQPWTPANMICAISCHQIARSVYDPLTLPTAEKTVEPYLAESIEPNADHTVWTITMRSGVTFHDGTPLDGAAVVDNLQRQQKSFLTGNALRDILPDGIVLSSDNPLALTVTMSRPWVDFPIYLAGQIGYIASPTWLAAVDADATKSTQPVGTGPFVFASYTPGESFRATKNPDYWNAPYPYLDEIEYRVIVDGLTRQSALEAGDVDLIHTTTGQSIADFREQADEFSMLEVTTNGETSYTMFNVGSDTAALNDKRVRCALANAQDNNALVERVQDGVNSVANSPFSPGQIGHLDETGYPTEQNMDLAKQLIEEYKAENPGPISIALSTTPDQQNQTIAQAQAEWFKEAGIDDVQISTIQQGEYILFALRGDFNMFQWRNHGGIFLDQQYIWWHSSNALARDELGLNFGRIKDPVIDEALDANRGETDPAKKQEYAETVAKQFGSECYNVWGWYTVWGLPHASQVKGLDAFAMPSGTPASLGAGIAGSFGIGAVWLDQ